MKRVSASQKKPSTSLYLVYQQKWVLCSSQQESPCCLLCTCRKISNTMSMHTLCENGMSGTQYHGSINPLFRSHVSQFIWTYAQMVCVKKHWEFVPLASVIIIFDIYHTLGFFLQIAAPVCYAVFHRKTKQSTFSITNVLIHQ